MYSKIFRSLREFSREVLKVRTPIFLVHKLGICQLLPGSCGVAAAEKCRCVSWVH